MGEVSRLVPWVGLRTERRHGGHPLRRPGLCEHLAPLIERCDVRKRGFLKPTGCKHVGVNKKEATSIWTAGFRPGGSVCQGKPVSPFWAPTFDHRSRVFFGRLSPPPPRPPQFGESRFWAEPKCTGTTRAPWAHGRRSTGTTSSWQRRPWGLQVTAAREVAGFC